MDGTGQEDLNGFLGSHRVVLVERKWWEDRGCWVFCVEWIEGKAREVAAAGGGKSRVDYREVLGDQEFGRFVKLRDLRKQVAEEEGVPVFTVFTNEQLAAMVKGEGAKSLADLKKIGGVGEGRCEKYGEKFLALLSKK